MVGLGRFADASFACRFSCLVAASAPVRFRQKHEARATSAMLVVRFISEKKCQSFRVRSGQKFVKPARPPNLHPARRRGYKTNRDKEHARGPKQPIQKIMLRRRRQREPLRSMSFTNTEPACFHQEWHRV